VKKLLGTRLAVGPAERGRFGRSRGNLIVGDLWFGLFLCFNSAIHQIVGFYSLTSVYCELKCVYCDSKYCSPAVQETGVLNVFWLTDENSQGGKPCRWEGQMADRNRWSLAAATALPLLFLVMIRRLRRLLPCTAFLLLLALPPAAMAEVTRHAITSGDGTSDSSGNFTVALPAVADNDCVVICSSTTQSTAEPSTTATGYSVIANTSQTAGPGKTWINCYYHRWLTGDATSIPFFSGDATATRYCYEAGTYAGAASTCIDSTPGGNANTTLSTTVNIDSITVSGAADYLIQAASATNSTGNTYSAPSLGAIPTGGQTAGISGGPSCMFAEAQLSTSGAIGDQTVTQSQSHTSEVAVIPLSPTSLAISSTGEKLQIVRPSNDLEESPPYSDEVNMTFTFTDSTSSGCESALTNPDGITVSLYAGSCSDYFGPGLELDLYPLAPHEVGSTSYGTFFSSFPISEPGSSTEAISARLVALPTPAGKCGEWTLNVEVAGINAWYLGLGNPSSGYALEVTNNGDGATGCLDIEHAIVGAPIDPPERKVRREVRR
jgi:hypothetical protein